MVFLSSYEASFITGAELVVDGGLKAVERELVSGGVF